MDFTSAEEKIIYERLTAGFNACRTADESSSPEENFYIEKIYGEHYSNLLKHKDECLKILATVKDTVPYLQLHSSSGISGKFKVFLKRIIRKLTFWYVEPMSQQQLVYNNLVVSALGLSESMREISDKQLLDIQKELSIIHKRIDRVLKRNELSDILDAWGHNY